MTYSSTSNLGLKLIDFDTGVWHDDTNDNWRLLDTVVSAATGVVGLAGAWSNSLAITVGQKFVDADDLTIWECLIAHTSSASGTFAGARAANPTYWEGLATGLRARGEWAAGVSYAAGDLAYDSSEVLYCVCATSHTSTTSMRDDIANWTIMLDGSAVSVGAAILYTSQTLTQSQQNQAKDNIDARSAPLITRYETAGGPYTHNFNAATRFFQIIGGGGGGGGAGPGGAVGSAASGGGGSSGFVGESNVLPIGVITTGTVNVGGGGAGGIGSGTTPANGADGTDTTWTDGTNSFTFGKGKGGSYGSLSTGGSIGAGGIPGTSTGTLYGSSFRGGDGNSLTKDSIGASGGHGADCRFGSGGAGGGTNADGSNATGLSAGGGGGSTNNNATARSGGAGSKGFLFVIEYF